MDRVSSALLAIVTAGAVSIAPWWEYSSGWGYWGMATLAGCGAALSGIRSALRNPAQVLRNPARSTNAVQSGVQVSNLQMPQPLH